MIKGTEIAEIRVTATKTSFINNQEKPINFSLLEGSTTNPSTQAIESYLSDLQRIDISTQLSDLAPEGSLAEKLDDVCEKFFLMNKKNFQLLLDEAWKVKAQELSEFFNEFFAGAQE
ncbi:hypothetical protein F8M41_019162 [Gigaspora margarita]|uniref:Uncharacterized protein n=1 Tax=Gigaspora margarita TaxID=4874 RepID=A0A8H4EKQ4_GIGMA|nr:hypothetical protein F8M41_019162 [Gigaspora margarita]